MSNNTMIVGMTFGMCRQSRKLTVEASEIEQKNNAARGTVSDPSAFYFRKKEGTKKIDGLDMLKKYQAQWKKALENYARYPFSSGIRLLPAQLVEEFHKTNQKFEVFAQGMWNLWAADEYPKWKSDAPTRMGAMYNEEDFPTLDDCRNRFVCSVVVLPLSDAEQWQRISLISKDLTATMQQQQIQAVEAARRAAHCKLWGEIMSKVTHIVDTLSKDKPRIFESMIGNLMAIADMVPAYAELTNNDPQLQAMAAAAKQAFGEIDMAELRKSQESKDEAIAKAKQLVDQYLPYARAFAVDDDDDEEPTNT